MPTGRAHHDSRVAYWYDLDDERAAGAVEVLDALRTFRRSDRSMRQRTQDDMDMGETDLSALQFLIRSTNDGAAIGPTDLARHLSISTAATAKLVRRLEKSGHIVREPHPHDRRSVVLRATDDAHTEVRATLSTMHRRMMEVALSLDAQERAVVVRFLTSMSQAVTEPVSE